MQFSCQGGDQGGLGHDGETSDGRKVQIKATFKDKLTFRTTPEYYRFYLFDRGSLLSNWSSAVAIGSINRLS